ncbi:hypothetical protein QQS21_000267 [Conoideocrella luteorostrata]|uniref:Uncharacterized protein n=1 Tax=Conoideocrella luteorostrata TaxID=1105319 RepID=A0AAJ0D1Z5_9HYPO|nr:hypothetical protein QQS21_000267 [Conoideocrella luteorostrata]
MASPSTGARESLNPSSIRQDTIRSSDYSYRPPSPPFINIPVPRRSSNPEMVMKLMPSYENIDPSQLTSQDLQIITQNNIQFAVDCGEAWTYEKRHNANAIVDFLFVGPTSIIRDHQFLKQEGITLMLVVRDSRMVGTLRSVDTASKELGIALQYIYLDHTSELIQRFSDTTRLINNHLLSVYHAQSRGCNGDGQILIETGDFRRGKVLITCESGNYRCAAIAAAYIMSVFGQEMVSVLQFMQVQRFSCIFDEDMKRMLKSWEDILIARSMVAQHSLLQNTQLGQTQAYRNGDSQAPPAQLAPISNRIAGSKPKRRLDALFDIDTDDGLPGASTMDMDRFSDRDPFVPFTDIQKNNM